MKREMAAVYDELLRRQRMGEKSVFLSAPSLAALREVAAARVKLLPEGASAEVKPSLPQRGSTLLTGKTGPDLPPAPSLALPEGTREEQWEHLKSIVLSDPWCQSQVKAGKQVVFGVGSLQSRIFFCGEAPGAEEELVGEPFVGPAGQLLDRIIQAMGLTRKEVYIGNIMNYRPPLPGPVGNRAPTSGEMAYCLPYLLAQLDIIRPEAIIALGKTAIDGLLGPDPKRRIGQVRGKWHSFKGIPLIPTFHPSYLLRNQSQKIKRQVWEDMLSVMDRLEMPVTGKQRNYFLQAD